jgi:hypothetical protein
MSWKPPTERRRQSLLWDAAAAVLLTALAIVLRLRPLGPSSLWFDDAWAALVVRAHTLHDVLLAGATAPGYAVVLKGWTWVAGFSELKAQMPALVAGVLAPPTLFLVLRARRVGRLGAAAGALVLVASVVHMTYSTRVKEYTLDSLVSVLLLGVVLWLADDVSSGRRWWIYLGTSVVAVLLSSPALVIVASSLCIVVVMLARQGVGALRVAVAPALIAAVFGVLWWALMLRPRVDEPLKAYWKGYYIPHDRGVAHAVWVLARGLKDVFVGLVPVPTTPAAALVVPAAVIVMLVARRFVPVLLLVVGPLAVAIVLAAAQEAPLGTGRTDIYLYPGLAMAIGLAVDELAGVSERVTAAALAVVVLVTAVAFQPALAYPKRYARPLVDEVSRSAAPSDTILVRPSDDFAFGLYSRWPVTFFRSHDIEPGFVVRVERNRLFFPGLIPHPPPGLDARPWRAAVAAAGTSPRVWLLVASPGALGLEHPRLEPVRRLLRQEGFVLKREEALTGADLTLWTHRPV